jgi:hypothetical protein
MWIAAGQETYADGIGFLVKNINASGVPVTFVQYQTMPHIWNVVMPFLPQSQHVTKLWGEACSRLAESRTQTSAAYFVALGALKMLPADSTNLIDLPDDELLRSMQAARDRLAKYVWKGPESKDAKLWTRTLQSTAYHVYDTRTIPQGVRHVLITPCLLRAVELDCLSTLHHF